MSPPIASPAPDAVLPPAGYGRAQRPSGVGRRLAAGALGLLRELLLRLVRLYHPVIARAGPALPPSPCIVVANHPSGLMDPLVLQLAIGRRLSFLGKATLFSNPVGRLAMAAFSAIAVARRQDARAPEDEEATAARNAQTFEVCRQLLAQGGDLALFPEGVSHDHPGLRTLRTGAARIALSALESPSPPATLSICPVGLLYRSKGTFRSQVSALVGDAIDVRAFAAAHGHGESAVRSLTDALTLELGRLVLHAESAAMADGLRLVAALTSPGADVGAVHQRALQLAAAFAALQRDDPNRAAALVEQAQAFLQMADELGLLASEDERAALVLEGRAGGAGRVARATASLLLLAPFGICGVVGNWLPWRLVGWLARRMAGSEQDVIATYKLIGGLLLFPLGWLSLAALAFSLGAGVAGGAAVALAAALTAPLGLRLAERLDVRRRALRAGWLRLYRADLAFGLAARRRELAQAVQTALGERSAAR